MLAMKGAPVRRQIGWGHDNRLQYFKQLIRTVD
jgi:hypothetical protein